MSVSDLEKIKAEYLKKGEEDYAAGRMTTAASDYIDAQGVAEGYLDVMGDVYICELCQKAYAPEDVNGVQVLKQFKGYTVDLRLQEFRHMKLGSMPEVIAFASLEGRALLSNMHADVT